MVIGIMFALSVWLAPQVRIVYESRTPMTWTRTVVLEAERFTKPNLVALAREFVRRVGDRRGAAVLTILVDETDSNPAKSAVDIDYAGWREEYDRLRRLKRPIADVVVMPIGAVLRISNGETLVDRVIVRGRDPLLFHAGDLEFEIVYISSRKIVDPFGMIPDHTIPGVYVVTRAVLTESIGEEITKAVIKLLAVHDVAVDIRNDVWFIDDAGFPVIYQFENSVPPTVDSYLASAQLVCGADERAKYCRRYKPTR